MQKGRLYGVGVGTGDPELITLKAARLIKESPVIATPVVSKGKRDSYALSIVKDYIGDNKIVLYLCFPMHRECSRLKDSWIESACCVKKYLDKGMDVVFVTIGDPSFYSTFSFLQQIISGAGDYNVEVIPGVSSIFACAASIGEPLTLCGDKLAVIPATYKIKEISNILDSFESIVFVKVSKVFYDLLNVLETKGLVDSAVYLSACGTENEKIVKNLYEVKESDLNYMSLVIVKKRENGCEVLE